MAKRKTEINTAHSTRRPSPHSDHIGLSKNSEKHEKFTLLNLIRDMARKVAKRKFPLLLCPVTWLWALFIDRNCFFFSPLPFIYVKSIINESKKRSIINSIYSWLRRRKWRWKFDRQRFIALDTTSTSGSRRTLTFPIAKLQAWFMNIFFVTSEHQSFYRHIYESNIIREIISI